MPQRKRFLTAILLGIGIFTLIIASAIAAAQSDYWRNSTKEDFEAGTMDRVDVWRQPGVAQLDKTWSPGNKVNDDAEQSRDNPNLTFALSGTQSIFLIVWDDERTQDHYSDIYFDRSLDGKAWFSDTLISGAHPMGKSKTNPDIAVRATDSSYWVVWQDTRNDDGDIFYTKSDNGGAAWDAAKAVYTETNAQKLPELVINPLTGYLFSVWEDERNDEGDIYISRYNPDVDIAWDAPVQVNDANTSEQRQASLAGGLDGNLYVAWIDERDRDTYDGDIYFSRWLSGTTWGAWSKDIKLNDASVDFASTPSVATASDGSLYVMWYERFSYVDKSYDFRIIVARSDDQGETWTRFTAATLPNAGASLSEYENPTMSVNQNGQVYVTWLFDKNITGVGDDILFAVSPDKGEHWTEAQVITNTAESTAGPTLAVDFQNRILVAWENIGVGSNSQIYASRYPSLNYANSGEYRSIEYDTGGIAAWGVITWTAITPPGTSLALATRVMTTTGANWTDWYTPTASGDTLAHPSGRIIQYRAIFASNGANTPSLNDVSIAYQSYQIYLPLVLK